MGRKAARETAMKLLYGWTMGGIEIEQTIQLINEDNGLTDEDLKYVYNVFNGVKDNSELIDSDISKYLKGWNIDRIAKIDLSILRVSIYEMLFRKDIPVNVSINEAIEMAKKYSNQDSGRFVNGLLANFARNN